MPQLNEEQKIAARAQVQEEQDVVRSQAASAREAEEAANKAQVGGLCACACV